MKPYRAKYTLTMCLFGLAFLASIGNSAAVGHHRVNLTVAETQIIPGYERFATTAKRYSDSVRGQCVAGRTSQAGLKAMQYGWHELIDAWMGVEHWRFGPIEADLRRHRIWFWPDKHGRTGKQIRRMLATQDTDKLRADRFAGISAAMQSLTSAERLLFAGSALDTLKNDTYPCAYLAANANNISQVAREILAEWKQPETGELALIRGSLVGNAVYESPLAVTTFLAKALHTQVVSIKDQKLARPMGPSWDRAKPKREESWRSQRGLRNIRINLEALRNLYGSAGQQGLRRLVSQSEDGSAINQAFDTVISESLDRIPQEMVLGEMVGNESHWARLAKLRDSLKTLRNLVQTRIPVALGINLGFNSLDGD